MPFLADLHIHSRFSRATSRELTLPSLHAWAQRKGLAVVGTGDITHPQWIEEIAEQLVPAEEGLFRLRPDLARAAEAEVPAACRGDVRFLLQGEVSSIYKHRGEVRKVHNVVFCPDLPTARRFLGTLDRLGNIRSDGRPILGLPARDVLEVLLQAGPETHLVPAHVWTPWFSVLGSKSGYDSVDDCFEDLSAEVFALETGLSSDPSMNWRVSALDRFALLSNSDAHSPANLGREANEFDCALSYRTLFDALRLSPSGDGRFLGTLEFFPEEGKYHLDGHRKCGQRLTPAQTRQHDARCPDCGAPVTVGVLHRVEELADRPEGRRPPGAKRFSRLVPLPEVVAECFGVGPASQRVQAVCERLWENLGPELHVLREAPLADVDRVAGGVVAEAVRRVRAEQLHIEAGYDGEFGTIRIFQPEERQELGRQGSLFGFSASAKQPAVAAPTAAEEQPSKPHRTRRPESEGSARPAQAGPATWQSLLDGLNPEQREAVLAPPSPLAIQAGPGTGKTRTLTHRIARKVLAGEALPERVLALTFTNRAVAEMGERLSALLGAETAARVTVCTLHRLGLRILREEAPAAGLPAAFQVLSRDECARLLAGKTGLSSRQAGEALDAFSLAQRGSGVPSDLTSVWDSYRQALTEAGAVDLDDLIALPVRLLGRNPAVRTRWQGRFVHVAVDEFQDMDPVQYDLVELLASGDADVTVIGDPNQAIYGFRGAAPELLQRFAAERPGAVRVALTRNYRSTRPVLAAALQALGEAQGVAPDLPPPLPDHQKVRLSEAADDRAEATHVAREVVEIVGGTSSLSVDSARQRANIEGGFSFGDVAVLYRLKAQRALLEEAFALAGVPCAAVGEESSLLRGRGRDALRALRRRDGKEAAGPSTREELARLGLPEDHAVFRAWTAAAAASGTVAELLDRVALERPEDAFDRRAERVTLLTLHASKGLEFPAVFVTGCEEGLLPYLGGEDDGPAAEIAEERRLLYVGMTRAQRLLHLTYCRSRFLHGERRSREPSRFLAPLAAPLAEFRRLASEPGAAKASGRQLKMF